MSKFETAGSQLEMNFDWKHTTGLSLDSGGHNRVHCLFSMSNNLESGFLFGSEAVVSWKTPQTLSGHSGPPLESFLKGILKGTIIEMSPIESKIELPALVTSVQLECHHLALGVRVRRLVPIASLPLITAGADFFSRRFARMHPSLGSLGVLGNIHCVTLDSGCAIGVCSPEFCGMLLIRSQINESDYEATLTGISIDNRVKPLVLTTCYYLENEVESHDSFMILE